MRSSKSRLLSCAAAAVLAVVGCGCGKEAPPDPGGGEKAPSRMKDPAYVKALEAQRAEKLRCMGEFSRAKAALDKALETDPEMKDEATKELKSKLDAAAKAVIDNQKASQELVAARVRAELKNSMSKQKKGD